MPSTQSPTSERGRELPKLARFEVLRRIGEGGVGLVYEAIDRTNGARVALKTLRIAGPDTLLTLKDEFRALADLAHPNLVRLGELLCDDGRWFFTMELVVGTTFVAYVTGDAPDDRVVRLDAARARGGKSAAAAPHRFDEGRLRASLVQLARGLSALHAAGKVHRDVKPSNVLVAEDGRVVILDFGLARDVAGPERRREDGSIARTDDGVVGTIPHMAPEQAAGGEVGAAADWYSVGTVLYQCLTGRAPFQGSASEVLRKKQTEDPRPPSAIAPDVPADLDALCMDLLRRDPAARPRGSEVLRRLEPRASEPPPRSIAPARATFVGRSRELAELDAAFARACAGQTAVVLVTGESGVGKSALVRRFARGLVPQALVLSGRCYEREDVPYKAIDAVVDALVLHLTSLSASARAALLPPSASIVAQAFPVMGRVLALGDEPPASARASGSRAALLAAMRDLFGRVARARPLVVAIDDLQWADADGLAVLAELLRPPDAPPMLFVGTARPAGAGGERPSGVTDARDEGAALFGLPEDARVLPLERLAPEEAIDLARLLLEGDEATGASLAQVLASEARGHPLFLDELVRHARAHGGRARAPVQLDDALHARVAALDRRERELLEVLAVAGVALHRDVAMRAAGLAPADYARVAQSLRAGHLARGFGAKGKETIEPYHDRVREAVAARLDPLVRRKWHSGLASALEATPSPDADALSTHWLGAGDPEASARYALEAADQAFAAFAFERAARLYERGLALGKIDEARRQVLRIQRAEALARAGLGALAAREFIEAARVAAPDDALDLRRRAAEELMIAGRIDEGDDAFQQVLAAVGIGFPMTAMGALASLLLCRLALWLRGMGVRERGAPTPRALVRHDACAGVAQALSVIDMVRGAYFQSRTLLFALDLGEPSRVGRALAIEAAQIAAAGPRMATRTERLLAQATAIAQHAGDAEGIATVEVARAYALFLQGRFRDGFDVAERASRTMRERHLGTFWAQRSAELMTIWTLAWMGRLRELGTRVRRAVREAEQRGDLYARTSLCTGVPHLAFLRDGDAQEARAIALAATRKWTQRGYHNQHFWSLLALANVDLYEGDGRAAWARVDREWPRVSRALLSRVQTFAIETTHLRARAALGAATDERGSARARVLRVADRCARRLASIDSPLAPPFARIVDAGVAASRGDGEGAQLHLEASVAGFDAAGLELHAACARRRLARLQGGDEGRAIGARADAWMEGEGIADRDAMTEAIAPGFAR